MKRRWIALLLLVLVLSACSKTPQPTPVSLPTESPLPTPTAVPVPLEAWPDPQANLNSFPPTQPFVVHFNQPVDLQAAGEIKVSASSKVRSRWNEARTQLAIEPLESFGPGTTFQLKLGQIKSASGVGFAAEPPEWKIHVMDYTRVTERPPYIETTANRRPLFELTFSRPMNTTSVERALNVYPSVPLDIQWQGQKLIVQPREPLLPGARYVFTVTDEAKDVYGIALDYSQVWEYSPYDLIAATQWLHRQGNANTPLVVRFNYPMDTASVLDALAIEPPIQGKLTWSTDRTVITMTPEIPLPGEMTYTLRFTGRLRDTNGNPFPAPEPLSFTTPSPILSTSPARSASVHPATRVEVKFDRLMDRAKTQAAFQITPQVRGSFEWRETTLVFRPEDGYLSEFTEYIVTIGTGAADARGEPVLRQPYTWSFSTRKLQDVANFGWGPNAQVVDADGRRAVQFQVVQSGQTALTFELYRLSLGQFLDRYSSGFRGVAGQEDRPISIEGTTLAKSWQVRAEQSKSYGTPREAVIPSDVPPGLYILNLKAGHLNDQLIVILTRHTLVLKQSDDQIVAWVTNVNGGPMADMEVVVLARDGKVISQGRTDEGGVFRTRVNRDPQPLIVIARDDQDITAAGLSNEWRSSGNQWGTWWAPTPPESNYAAYIYTDRPIYRPAQTVFFKAILRDDDDAIISLPSKGKPVTLRIRDARNNIVQTFQLATNDLGTVNGQFQLAEGAMLGEYAVELVVDGESYRQAFKVQDYRKPDYQVSVQTDSTRYLVGDTISVSVDSRYFFGEPVPNAELTLKLYGLGSPYGGWWESDQGDSEFVWYRRDDLNMMGRTDENGRFVFSFKTPKLGAKSNTRWGNSLVQARFGIEATVDDGTHQTVSSFAVITVFDAVEKLSLDMGSYFKTPGQPFTVRAIVRTIADEPVSGRTLTLQLRRYSAGARSYSDIVQSLDLTTGSNGQASSPFTVQEPGYYQLYLTGKDRLGNDIGFTSWLYVFSDAARWPRRNSGELAITTDRSSYAPGDTAQLLIESTFSGPALLTFERGTIRRERPVNLTAPLTRIEVKLQPDDAPNIFVKVNAWKEQDTALAAQSYSSLPDSRLHVASVELRVPVTDKTLNVTITPDYNGAPRSFAPRETVSFTVRVTNQRGQGVPAEVSLALVDEAIFSLSKELSGPILDAFYRPRANQVRTYDAMSPVRWLGGMGGGGGGGDGAAGAPRSDFPDTAAWLPLLRTDGNGEVVVKLRLPDNLTSWRITAKAVTANTEVGEAFINITTHQPIVVRPILPRALTAGDRVELTAIVHNYSDRARALTVSIEAPGLQLNNPITQSVTLTRGEIRGVGWSALAPEAGEISVTVRASAGDMGDAVRLTFPVRPLAVPGVTNQIGEFTGEFNTTLTWPEGALSVSTVKIQLNRSIAGTLLDGLEFLTGYPYG